MKRRNFVFLCILRILIFILTGCSPKEEPKINDKLDAEISYIEDLILKIVNKYAKKEYTEDNKVNFDYIKDDVNRINDSSAILILDLTEINIANEQILNYSNHLNDLIITIGKKDEIKMIDDLSQMYTDILMFKSSYTKNKNEIKKAEIKKEVLDIFNLSNKTEFENANEKIENVIQNYKNLMNDNDYAKENSYNLNKIYILLQEYKNSLITQNYDLISIKYINTIENL